MAHSALPDIASAVDIQAGAVVSRVILRDQRDGRSRSLESPLEKG